MPTPQRKKKIDIAYVATVTGDLGFCYALNTAVSNNNLSFLAITPNKRDHAILKKNNINSLYCGPYSTSKLNNKKHEPPPNESDYILCEKSYFGLPEFILRKISININNSVNNHLTEYDIKLIIQNPGGEIIRGAVQNYATKNNITTIFMGEFIQENGGSTLYCDDKKTLIKRKKEFQRLKNDKKHEKHDSIVKYKRLNLIKLSKTDKFIETVKHFDMYSVISATGYRLIKQKDKITNYIINKFIAESVNYNNPNKKRILVPLNVSAESELFIRNREFIDATFIIKKMASLTNACDIFIKGHPGEAKSMTLRDACTFKKQGYKIINSNVAASTLIKQFDGVTFVSSTVGIEAIRSGIPINCIGNWPYYTNAKKHIEYSCATTETHLINSSKFFDHQGDYCFQGKSYGNLSDLENLISSMWENQS